jgi:hypothetical protein
VSRKLPALNRRDAIALIKAFATDVRHDGDKITSHRRDGGSFTIHLEHGGGLRPDQLSRVLRYVGVSRTEFDAWRR